MSGGQTKNAALTTALAFHYQVLIGLEKCFALEEGQSIWFETDGDVSLISANALTSSHLVGSSCRLFSVVGCRRGGELDERNGHQTNQSNQFFMMTCPRLTA